MSTQHPTDDDIRALLAEAQAFGDVKMARICDRALCGMPDALFQVAKALEDASAQIDAAEMDDDDSWARW
jgi:hypothetical protein